ncbi:hypothetical protein A1359_08390 [Methylomonas lenta]|uniref:Uncharacterized protein n=1 Tax=Methylomonas lenta TaxID=980561 RepID=A0A177NH13_9GAMM|nr:hypothetical protein [Methylomonas lenta]OAI16350.1 hypothetical protein A1359_08390 [Methylomonas lenta]
MSTKPNHHLLLKTLILGGLIAALVYLFHPGVGQFSLLINGQPVAEPLFRLAAIPALLLVMLFIGVLSVLAMLGVGMFIFMGVLGFSLLSILIIAPYFWPVLLVFLVIVLIMSSGGSKNT